MFYFTNNSIQLEKWIGLYDMAMSKSHINYDSINPMSNGHTKSQNATQRRSNFTRLCNKLLGAHQTMVLTLRTRGEFQPKMAHSTTMEFKDMQTSLLFTLKRFGHTCFPHLHLVSMSYKWGQIRCVTFQKLLRNIQHLLLKI